MRVYAEVALSELRRLAAQCPTRGAVGEELEQRMFNAAVVALSLGATSDEITAAMRAGFDQADWEEIS